jgi:hypothetical protein
MDSFTFLLFKWTPSCIFICGSTWQLPVTAINSLTCSLGCQQSNGACVREFPHSFVCRTAGYKSHISRRSCARQSRHGVSCLSSVFKQSIGGSFQVRSCCCAHLMQPSRFKFTVKTTKLAFQIIHFTPNSAAPVSSHWFLPFYRLRIHVETESTNWPIVPAPGDRVWRIRWNENWQGKPKCFVKHTSPMT